MSLYLIFVSIIFVFSNVSVKEVFATSEPICDTVSAEEECRARGCECWDTATCVKYKGWLEACINKLCSYGTVCENYGCTFEECVEGNCDLEIEFTEICEEYCTGNSCAQIDYPCFSSKVVDASLAGSPTEVSFTIDSDINGCYFPELSKCDVPFTIQFQFTITKSNSAYEWGRHGGFYLGSSDNRWDFQNGLVTVIHWIDRPSQHGFVFAGINGDRSSWTPDSISDYSFMNDNPNGIWKLTINENKKASFYFNNHLIQSDFTVIYPNDISTIKLSFFAYLGNRITISDVSVSKLE